MYSMDTKCVCGWKCTYMICDLYMCRLKSHQSELKEKEKSWKESEKSYKKEREALSAIENQLAKLDVRSVR